MTDDLRERVAVLAAKVPAGEDAGTVLSAGVELVDLRNQITRLRAEVKKWQSMHCAWQDRAAKAEQELIRLRAENERLREALEGVTEIAESYLNMMPDRHGIHGPKIEAARAALTEPTKENTHG